MFIGRLEKENILIEPEIIFILGGFPLTNKKGEKSPSFFGHLVVSLPFSKSHAMFANICKVQRFSLL